MERLHELMRFTEEENMRFLLSQLTACPSPMDVLRLMVDDPLARRSHDSGAKI